MKRDFLKCLEWQDCPSLLRALHVFGGISSTLDQAVDNSALAFSSCLCRPSRLAINEWLGPSQVVPEHMHRLIHIQGLLGLLGICWRFSKPLWHFIALLSIHYGGVDQVPPDYLFAPLFFFILLSWLSIISPAPTCHSGTGSLGYELQVASAFFWTTCPAD